MIEDAVLHARALRVGYPGGFALDAGDLALPRGSLVGLLGPNASGKTTLLKTLAGLLRPLSGQVRVTGQPLASLAPAARARLLAYVPQDAATPFAQTVWEVVALGRHPHLGLLGGLTERDREAVRRALAQVGLGGHGDRSFPTLSAGERRRVLLARALAQDAPILLLDEPVANLDLRHQQETYELLRTLVEEGGHTVLLADHHVNLMAAYVHRVLVLAAGRVWGEGSPAELVNEEMLAEVFGLRMRVERDEAGRPFCRWLVPMPRDEEGRG
jgi:iron complex transport system ATP-binding protein